MPERLTRRRLVAAAAAAVAGCSGDGDGRSGTPEPTPAESNPALGDVEQWGDLRLTSTAFEDGGAIPRKYGRNATDVNPPLSIEGVPAAAESLTLVMDDPDAVDPAGTVWLHWLVWNIPPSTTIPEGWEPTRAVQGTNDFGERGYGGPAPPDEPHTYRFKLYALDTTLDLPESADKREVGAAMRDARLAQTQLTGTYAP